MSFSLYRKWRPHLWEEVVGQEHIVTTLQNAIRGDRVAHAYLFAGPRGTGKTTTARLLAKAVNCLDADPAKRPCDQCEHCLAVNEGRFMDLIEIDAASNTSVDDVRDLRDKINFSPSQGRFKVYIIDEVHMLSTAAFNALLKTLEEPPAHAIFILATTEVHKIPATVLSRCQWHEFRRIPVEGITRQLKKMAEAENISVDTEALGLIARQSTGSLRDAISLLDQLASTGETISLSLAHSVLGTATNQFVMDLARALIDKNASAGFACIHQALDRGTDARQFSRQVVEYLRGLMLIKVSGNPEIDSTPETLIAMIQQAATVDLKWLLAALDIFNTAAVEIRSAWQPSLPLEIAMVQAVSWSPMVVAEVEKAAILPTKAAMPGQPNPPPVGSPQPNIRPDRPAGENTLGQVPENSRVDGPSETPPLSKTTAVEPAPVRPGTPLTEQKLRQEWNKIRAIVRKALPQTDALLNSIKTISIRDNVLIFGFASEVVKSKMETGNHIELTLRAIEETLGSRPPLRCIVVSGKNQEAPTSVNSEEAPLVNEAIQLGGRIVDKNKIHPGEYTWQKDLTAQPA